MDKPKVILVVDDFQSIRKVLVNTLSSYGFTTMEAENGKEALGHLRDNENEIDLILSDYNMPEMDGLEFLQIVKQDEDIKHIPFLLLTSETSTEKMREAKSFGLDAWIGKPYKIEAFINQIKYLIEKNGSNVSL